MEKTITSIRISFGLIATLLLLVFGNAQLYGQPLHTGIETSDRDRAGWYQGIVAWNGHVFFHRIVIAEGRKQCQLVQVDPDSMVRVSKVLYTVSEENHSHGGDLMIDGSGRIHVIYGASPVHLDSDGLHHLVSDKPMDVTGAFSPGEGFPDGIGGTYRHYDRAPNGDLYAFIKAVPEDRSRGEGQLWHWINGESRWEFVAVINAEQGKTTYSPWIEADRDGNLHLIWVWGNGRGASKHRHLGSYLQYRPGTGTFHRADGSEYPELPLTTSMVSAWQPLEPGVAWNQEEIRDARMRLDVTGRPVIEYRYIGQAGRIARWDGNRWIRKSHEFRNDYYPSTMISVHDDMLYFYKGGNLSVSRDWGDTWESFELATGLSVFGVVPYGSLGDVVLYFKDKEGPLQDIYIAYVSCEENPCILPLPPVEQRPEQAFIYNY